MSWKVIGTGVNPKHKMKDIKKADKDRKLNENNFKNVLLKHILKGEIERVKDGR